ncbi:MAG: hypothetical protein LJF15_16875 [Acidobacteria bacterium]|jgi:hypothetical protein|nr:hypothetical protein [Acidobacteriota bacterium]
MELTRLGLTVLAASLLIADASARETAGNRVLFSSPEEVHPLLVGLPIPDGTLRNQKGEEVSVGPATTDRPMVYVFYRGYW